jgi:membrane protein YdbS with pleckstrin-like domain
VKEGVVGFPDNVLAKGEKVERDLHPHWLTVVVPTILGLLLAAACIFIVMQTPDDETGNRIQWIAVAVLVLVAIPAVVVPYLRWRTTHYAASSRSRARTSRSRRSPT